MWIIEKRLFRTLFVSNYPLFVFCYVIKEITMNFLLKMKKMPVFTYDVVNECLLKYFIRCKAVLLDLFQSILVISAQKHVDEQFN